MRQKTATSSKYNQDITSKKTKITNSIKAGQSPSSSFYSSDQFDTASQAQTQKQPQHYSAFKTPKKEILKSKRHSSRQSSEQQYSEDDDDHPQSAESFYKQDSSEQQRTSQKSIARKIRDSDNQKKFTRYGLTPGGQQTNTDKGDDLTKMLTNKDGMDDSKVTRQAELKGKKTLTSKEKDELKVLNVLNREKFDEEKKRNEKLAKMVQETIEPKVKQRKADVYTRTGIDANLPLKPHELTDMVKLKVQQQAIPAGIKKGIDKADRVFGEYLKVNKVAPAYDFGQGYYASEPPESRGHDLLKLGKDPMSRKEEFSDVAEKKKSAQQIEEEQLSVLNAMTNAKKFSGKNANQTSMTVTERSGGSGSHMRTTQISQGSGNNSTTLAGVTEAQIDEEEMHNLRLIRQQTTFDQLKSIKNTQTVIDLTKVQATSQPIKRQMEQKARNLRSTAHVRTRIQEMRLKEECDRKIYYLNRQKQGYGIQDRDNSDKKPPLAPQMSAGPASSQKLKTEEREPQDEGRQKQGAQGILGIRSFILPKQQQTQQKRRPLSTIYTSPRSFDLSTDKDAQQLQPSSGSGPQSMYNPQDRNTLTPSHLPSIFFDQYGAQSLAMDRQRTKIQLKKQTATSQDNIQDQSTMLPSLNASRSVGTTLKHSATRGSGGFSRRMSRSMLSEGEAEEERAERSKAHKVNYDGGQVILIKPHIDASDKELHRRNDLPNEEKNLRAYLEAGGFQAGEGQYFVPTKLGQFSKDVGGIKMNVISTNKEVQNYDQTVEPEQVDALLKQLKAVQSSDIERAIKHKNKNKQDQISKIGDDQTKSVLEMFKTEVNENDWTVIKPGMLGGGAMATAYTQNNQTNLTLGMFDDTTMITKRDSEPANKDFYDDDDFEDGDEDEDDIMDNMGTSKTSLFGNISMIGLQQQMAVDQHNENAELRSHIEYQNQQQDFQKMLTEHIANEKHKIEDQKEYQDRKPVFINKRWQRQDDMRDIVRHMADHGEKMIQEDRDVDYKEDFEESQDSDNLALSSEHENEDEEWNSMKRTATLRMESMSKKQMIMAIVKNQKKKTDVIDRSEIGTDGVADQIISAFDGPQHDEIKARRERQLRIAEEHKAAMKTHEEIKVESVVGIADERIFQRHNMEEDIVITTSSGQKIRIYRYINKQEAIMQMDAKKKEAKKFRALIRENKQKRLVDDHAMEKGLAGGSNAKRKKQDPNAQLVDDEVETILIEKHSNLPKKVQIIEQVEKTETINKQALIDNIVMDNKKYLKSLAMHKRLWKSEGEDGAYFQNKDLQEWYNVYNQTQLNKAKQYLQKLKKVNDNKLAVGQHMKQIKLDGVAEQDAIFEDSPRFGTTDIDQITKKL